MKLRMFLSGLLIGGAIGLMAGGALVRVPGDVGGQRNYPQGLALMIALVGGVGVGSVLRGSVSENSRVAGDRQ